MEEKEGFKVIDRRGQSEESESPKEEKKTEPQAEQPKQAEQAQQGANQAMKLDFTSFIMSLAHQAVVLLGEAPNPETNLVATNIEAARQTIDILGILEDKTKGNLNDAEKNLLDEVLTGLRMAYVKKTKGE